MVKKIKRFIIEVTWDDFTGTEPFIDLTEIREPFNHLGKDVLGINIQVEHGES